MDIKKQFSLYNISLQESVVIGSGILQVVGLRQARDFELIVTQQCYQKLLASGLFEQKKRHTTVWLEKDAISVATQWTIVDEVWTFERLLDHSEIIHGVRYITVEFLFHAKSQWLLNGEFRQKDKDDIVLMDAYLAQKEALSGCKCC